MPTNILSEYHKHLEGLERIESHIQAAIESGIDAGIEEFLGNEVCIQLLLDEDADPILIAHGDGDLSSPAFPLSRLIDSLLDIHIEYSDSELELIARSLHDASERITGFIASRNQHTLPDDEGEK
jgi:hypothetical protein